MMFMVYTSPGGWAKSWRHSGFHARFPDSVEASELEKLRPAVVLFRVLWGARRVCTLGIRGR